MKFLGLLALTLAAAAPVPASAPAADGITYHPLPAWTPGHPTLPTQPKAWQVEWHHRAIEVDGHVYAVSRPTWVASYLSSLLPSTLYTGRDSRVLAARLPHGSVVHEGGRTFAVHRSLFDDLRDAAARGYEALGDRRTYAAVMLVVAVLNFSSIVLVLLFFRGGRDEREETGEEALAPEGKIKLLE